LQDGFTRTAILALILVLIFIVQFAVIKNASADEYNADEHNEPRDRSGLIFYMDNDLFITPNLDRDYTAGLSIVLTGRGAASHLLSIDPVLGVIDSWSGIDKRPDFELHSYEFGLSGFTPEEIETTSSAIQDDRPYASLVYIANNRQYVDLQNKRSFISTLSIGMLGLSTAANLQNAVHKVIDLDEAVGWHNQISDGGELTLRYGVSKQTVAWYDHSGSSKYEIKTSMRGSIGYLTDVTWSIGGRWGDFRSPWWAFNPQNSEYTEKAAPALPITPLSIESNNGGELYVWSGLGLRIRAYNVFLQGQYKDSAVTYESNELNHIIIEAWFGITAEIFSGMRVSYLVRAQTAEIKRGFGSRNLFWGGLIVSQGF